MTSFSERIIGAARLDVHVYEEVEADLNATRQAMGVVVLSSIAHGIGTITMGGMRGLVAGAIAALIGWCIWAGLIYLIGTKVLPESETHSNMGELLRTIGFAASPGLLRVLGVIPFLGGWLIVAANIWMLIAMVIGVRQALDYRSTGRAVGVCLIGWFAQVIVIALLMILLGGPGAL